MLWVYLSPHFDDIALSCGGLVWQQAQSKTITQIWTICAADPPSERLSPFAEKLHTRWGISSHSENYIAVRQRRNEDLASCTLLGATPKYFSIPDCIYRTDNNGLHLYPSETAIFGTIHPVDNLNTKHLASELNKQLPEGKINLVIPMAIGHHVDHRLTRAIAEKLATERPDCLLWYYADMPYVLNHIEQLSILHQPTWEGITFPLSKAAISAWISSFSAHASQLSTFWPNEETAQATLNAYTQLVGGVRLWKGQILDST